MPSGASLARPIPSSNGAACVDVPSKCSRGSAGIHDDESPAKPAGARHRLAGFAARRARREWWPRLEPLWRPRCAEAVGRGTAKTSGRRNCDRVQRPQLTGAVHVRTGAGSHRRRSRITPEGDVGRSQTPVPTCSHEDAVALDTAGVRVVRPFAHGSEVAWFAGSESGRSGWPSPVARIRVLPDESSSRPSARWWCPVGATSRTGDRRRIEHLRRRPELRSPVGPGTRP
jgi:hypothetical protein